MAIRNEKEIAGTRESHKNNKMDKEQKGLKNQM
jgi:hypothetical protein